MEVVPDPPQLGALAATSVAAEQVVGALGWSQPLSCRVDSQDSTKSLQAVVATSRLGVHPTRILFTLDNLVELQATVYFPDIR